MGDKFLGDGFFFEEEEWLEECERYNTPQSRELYEKVKAIKHGSSPTYFYQQKEEHLSPFDEMDKIKEDIDEAGMLGSYTPPYLTQKNKLSEFVNQLVSTDPVNFWSIMRRKANPQTCFLADFIASPDTKEEEICAVIDTLYRLGLTDKDEFYQCMTGYAIVVDRTPLNELIKRIPSRLSRLYTTFSILLSLIETLPEDQKIGILKKRDRDRLTPRKTAFVLSKDYICEKINGSGQTRHK